MHDFSYNDATIEAYSRQAELYIKNTPHTYNERHKFFLHWIDSSLALMPKDGSVLEIGSGHGRDARYIESKGFKILRTDAAQAFVQYLTDRNEPTTYLNVLRDEIPKNFNLIYADGVMPHFSPRDLPFVLKKIYDALPPGGVLSFNAKQGKGEDWINEKEVLYRYTCYWQPGELRKIIREAGFELRLFKDGVYGGDIPDRVWIHVIALKKTP